MDRCGGPEAPSTAGRPAEPLPASAEDSLGASSTRGHHGERFDGEDRGLRERCSRSGGIFDLDRKRSRIALIERDSTQPNFWDDNTKAQALLKEKASARGRAWAPSTRSMRGLDDAQALLELAPEANDEATRARRRRPRSARSRREVGEAGAGADALRRAATAPTASWTSTRAPAARTPWTGPPCCCACTRATARRRAGRWRSTTSSRAKRRASRTSRSRIEGEYAYGYLKAESGRAPAGAHQPLRRERAPADRLRLGGRLPGGGRRHRDRHPGEGRTS